MSEHEAGRAQHAQNPPARRPGPLLLTAVVLGVVMLIGTVFTGIWTDKLWFDSVGFSKVFSTMLGTRVLLFAIFGTITALVVGASMVFAYRMRPLMVPRSPDQLALMRYRHVLGPVWVFVVLGASTLMGIFAGMSATGEWREFLLWRNQKPFGKVDAYFGKDLGFYVFNLPWLHYLVDFASTILVLSLIAAVVVHYVFGGIRVGGGQVFSSAARIHVSVILALLLLVKAAGYWLSRFDLVVDDGGLITGMTYTRDHAVLPSRNILMWIAVVCAILILVNIFRRGFLLAGVSLALLALSALVIGMIWPAVLQKFTVAPSEADKEAPYIAKNIAATREAYGVADVSSTSYAAKVNVSPEALQKDAASLPGIRLIDPHEVSETFEQLQQVSGYYSVPSVLDVDRYVLNGKERDMVVAARELNQDGIANEAQSWNSLHTVYTHGYGMVAAFGNQKDAADQAVTANENDGEPVWAEKDIPPVGQLTQLQAGGYRPQIYFGEQSPTYSIVGKPNGGNDVELDIPGQDGKGAARTYTYTGKGGVGVGTTFRKLLYAVKFSDFNIVLSSRVNENSKVLYDRQPAQMLTKVAPWLTAESDALPAVIDGRIVWLLDGYTTSDMYPLAQRRSLLEMTSDALTGGLGLPGAPSDEINYMRNAVKATVDAYDGTVTLYAWDETDPMLQAWMKAFPGTVKPKSEIPSAVLAHMRYPEDLYKVQRDILADYHVSDPGTFYTKSDKWVVPDDPNDPAKAPRSQPPYRLSVAPAPGADPVFSLTSVYVPNKRNNLATFMSVGADATKPETYGKFQMLVLPKDNAVSGPSQIANTMNNDQTVSSAMLPYTRSKAEAVPGNLLTLPVGGGLLYVQPLYTQRTGGVGNYPQLRYVLASFGGDVGIGKTLDEALRMAVGDTSTPPTDPGAPTPSDGTAKQLLEQAMAKFRSADAALKRGDLATYAKDIKAAQDLVSRALAKSK